MHIGEIKNYGAISTAFCDSVGSTKRFYARMGLKSCLLFIGLGSGCSRGAKCCGNEKDLATFPPFSVSRHTQNS